jgi:hypothetical protein
MSYSTCWWFSDAEIGGHVLCAAISGRGCTPELRPAVADKRQSLRLAIGIAQVRWLLRKLVPQGPDESSPVQSAGK